MFVKMEKHWDEARSYCWKAGAEMLVIPDQDSMEFVKSVLNSKELGWSNNGVWNGASDLRSRGWEWTTGEFPFTLPYILPALVVLEILSSPVDRLQD